MIAGAAVTVGLDEVTFSGSDALVYAKRTLITGSITTLAWIAATFFTPAESQETLISFYRRVHPSVYGWRQVAKLVPELPEVRDFAGNAFSWIMGIVLVYGCLFGIGKLIFGEWFWGLLLLVMGSGVRLLDLLASFAPGMGDALRERGGCGEICGAGLVFACRVASRQYFRSARSGIDLA